MAANTNILPAPDDLAGWKAAEGVLNQRISDHLWSADLVTPALLRKYFGCRDEDYLLDEYANLSIMTAFIEWLVNDYRPILRSTITRKKGKKKPRRKATRRGKTLAEKLLAEGLPAAEAKLLEACSQAHPSIFRISHVKARVSLTAEDILLGGERLVHDKLLSGCVRAGQYITGRVFPVGQFHFISIAGPPLAGPLAMEAATYLESLGVEFTHEGLRRDAGKFGRLWEWYDQRTAEDYMPRLQNTDGEELIYQTASFSVSDEGAARRTIAARDDIDYDDEDDQYHWFRYQGKGATIPGETLHLGSMRFLADELILDVNSAERLKVARQWLERIPGVEYLAVKTRDLTEPTEDVPPDDRAGRDDSVEMTPELVSHIQESFNQHYMGWLDTPLPILAGKSPRQTCKTEAGRRKVARLIRTIPQPMGEPGAEIVIPRKEMLRSLGLDSQ